MSNQQQHEMSINQLCVIDGDYILSKNHNLSPRKSLSKLNELVESYKKQINEVYDNEEQNEENGETSSSSTSKRLTVLHSKDGADLCQSILNGFGITTSNSTSSLSTTINELDVTTSTTMNNLTTSNHQRYAANQIAAASNASSICFVINDFDQNDKCFLKLEETQSKLTNLFNNLNQTNTSSKLSCAPKRFMIYGWPVLHYCLERNLKLTQAVDVERPLYSKLMSGCFVCFTGFRKENKNTVAHCIKLVHYMGGSVRKEYNKKITHLIVKSTLSTKYKTAYNIGKCHLLTEEWIIDTWKHRNEIDFDVNNEEFLKKFQLKALYSLSIAFYGFTPEETQHMKEVTIENGGTPISDLNDPQCTHIVINDQEVKQLPSLNDDCSSSLPTCSTNTGSIATTPTSSKPQMAFNGNMSPFANTRASVVRAEWFWASIQICCRASECLYEFTKPKIADSCKPLPNNILQQPSLLPHHDPPTKRMKLSSDNLLSHETLNSTSTNNISHTDSPHFNRNINNNNNTPIALNNQNSSMNKSGANLLAANSSHNTSNATKMNNSSNNLLQNLLQTNAESPTLNLSSNNNINNTTNNRLSTNTILDNNKSARNNMSNNNLSTSASLLDATTDDAMSIDSPFDKQRDNSGHNLLNSASSNGANGANGSKKMNKRSQRIYELYETEKRFVNILHTIIYFFKEPIESPDQVAGPILDQTECKEIFGNLPPIYEVHCKIKDRLERLANRILSLNEETISVGEIYLDNADALLKTYPPFVNFYEKTKDAIVNCDKIKPRFHAFLKIAQSKPECGRQTLVELLIRPVQRLPSTLLLLDDILKETPKGHRDHELLSKAIASLKEVMTHINEDKRKIENQLAMFVLINDIENCPATLLSSHRSFLKKLDAYETSNELLKKGAQLTLFLFTDCLEICKPRLKLINASKSPNTTRQRTPQKCYKHIALFSLNNVTKVCDIVQNSDDTDLFGILCRLAGEKDKFFSFKVIPTSSSTSSNSSTHPSMNTMNHNMMCSTSSMMISNGHSTISSVSSTSSASSSVYASTTNLNFNEENHQALSEKKEYIKLLAQGICNVKCITEYNSPKLLTSALTSSNTNLTPSNNNSNSVKCIFDEFNSNISQIEMKLERDHELFQVERLFSYSTRQVSLHFSTLHSTGAMPQRLFYSEPTKKKPITRYSKRLNSSNYGSQQKRLSRTKSNTRLQFYYKPTKSILNRKYSMKRQQDFRQRRISSTHSKRHRTKSIQDDQETREKLNNHIINLLNQKDNILCTIEAKQLQIDLNESGGSKKLDAVKSYARIINRRVSRAFSFSQDTPNKIKKTISSVFRSPFQSSFSQHSLNEQKASKLTSLASLQLTPTLLESKRKFITLQKSRDTLLHPFFSKQQTLSNINCQTTSSLISLDNLNENVSSSSSKISSTLERTLSNNSTNRLGEDDCDIDRSRMPDITNMLQQSNSLKRQFT